MKPHTFIFEEEEYYLSEVEEDTCEGCYFQNQKPERCKEINLVSSKNKETLNGCLDGDVVFKKYKEKGKKLEIFKK